MVGKYDSLYVGGATYCCTSEVLPGHISLYPDVPLVPAQFFHGPKHGPQAIASTNSPTLGAPIITTFLFIPLTFAADISPDSDLMRASDEKEKEKER